MISLFIFRIKSDPHIRKNNDEEKKKRNLENTHTDIHKQSLVCK